MEALSTLLAQAMHASDNRAQAPLPRMAVAFATTELKVRLQGHGLQAGRGSWLANVRRAGCCLERRNNLASVFPCLGCKRYLACVSEHLA